MDPVQTLHDFTLNLLNDSVAREAFGADPAQALSAAGLGDVSAADVHEVIPLVLDYAPVGDLGQLNGLEGLPGGLPGGLSGIERADQGLGLPQDGPQDAIGQLQALTQNFGVLPELPGQTDLANAAGATALAHDLTSGFSPLGDPSHGLDSSIVDEATQPVTDVTGNLPHTGDLAGQVGDLTSTVPGADTVGAVTGGGLPAPATDVAGLGSHLGDLTNVLGGAGDLGARDFGGELTHGAGHHAGGIEHNVENTIEHNTAVSHVGDVANNIGAGSGVSEVHDVVSHVGNGIGNVGADLGHVEIASGNDVHIGH